MVRIFTHIRLILASTLEISFNYSQRFVLDNIPTVGEVKRTTSTETYLHGLYKYTNYSIKVLAYTGAGDGVLSSPIYCTTEEDGKCNYNFFVLYS